MAKGSSLDIVGLLGTKAHPFAATDAGLRLVNFYVVEWDEMATRIDIKIGANRYCTVIRSTMPAKRVGDKFLATDDLITPDKGVIGCLNIKAAKADIIEALEELLADIRSDVQPESIAAA